MPNNRIFDLLNKPVADPNHNAFDLGQFFPFSLKLGQVKPIYFTPTVPGGHYRLSVNEITHTEPFITDPFVRMSKHIEFVFVPYSQLWHGFSQFIGHANDPQSSYEQGHAFVPCFSLGYMLQRIWRNFSNSAVTDIQGLRIGYSALSLLDMLGYGAHPIYNMGDSDRNAYISSLFNKYVSAWNLLAYNKYWNTFLRDTQHTQPLNPAIFNADRVPCRDQQTCRMDNYYSDDEMLELVTIKYRKVKRDIFTSALTSRQFGAVESVTFNISGSIAVGGSAQLNGNTGYDSLRWNSADGRSFEVKPTSIYPSSGDSSIGNLSVDSSTGPFPIRHNHAVTGTAQLSGSASISGSTSGFDVYTLLTAQLMQKWREQIQRAGNQTEDRIRAIYGSKPAFDAENQPYIIGSTSYDITANQVTSTSNTETAKLADIAAKGVGYAGRNEFEFSASEFGVILAVTYVLPENSYLNPVDKTNTLIEPFDYYVSQLENLGLEQIEGFFRGTVDYRLGEEPSYIPRAYDSPGFAARYWYYKQKPNVVHLGFEHGRENSKWMPSRISIDAATGSTLNPYYVAPNEYDTVFGTITDFNLDTDQFIGCCRVSCDAVLPMSELGLPRW